MIFNYITIMIKSENDSINTIKKQILLNLLLILQQLAISHIYSFGLWQFRCYIWHQSNLHNVVSEDFSYKPCE